MKPQALRLTVLVLAAVLCASSAHAAYYTVTLKNGSTFETRYRPVKAEWDTTVSMFLTDRGNWIAVNNDDIADVVSVFEESGFGYQLNNTTRFIGWSPNDLVEDKVDEDGNIVEESQYDIEADQGAGTADYSIDQFLTVPTGGNYGNPTTVGGGIPIVGEVGEDN